MKISELTRFIRTVHLNNMRIGEVQEESEESVNFLIRVAIIRIYTDLLLLIDNIDTNLIDDDEEITLPDNFTGTIVDISDNRDRRDYYLDRDSSLVPIHRMGYNKLIVEHRRAKDEMGNDITKDIIISIFFSIYPEDISCGDTCIPDIIVNAIALHVRWQVSTMQPKTSMNTIDTYKKLYDEEIMMLKNRDIEISYEPRSTNLFDDTKYSNLPDNDRYIHDNRYDVDTKKYI